MSLKDKKNKLEEEFQNIKNSVPKINPQNHLVEDEDMPDFGEIEIYDYDKDVETIHIESTKVIESLVDMYLGDVDKVKELDYVKYKMKDDIDNYAETKLLTKLTRKLLFSQFRMVDQGENGSRFLEVITTTMKEMRENNKYNSTVKTDIEKFYREMRKDLGLNDLGETNTDTIDDENDETGTLVDTIDLNNKISEILKNKKS